MGGVMAFCDILVDVNCSAAVLVFAIRKKREQCLGFSFGFQPFAFWNRI